MRLEDVADRRTRILDIDMHHMKKTHRLLDVQFDPMGAAISDFWANGKASRLRVFSPMFDEDEIPVETLFRDYDSMPPLEQHALDLVKGRTLIRIQSPASTCCSLI